MEVRQLFFDYEKEVNDFGLNTEAETRKLNCQLEEVSQEDSASEAQTRGEEDTTELEFHHGKRRAHKMQAELGERMTKRPKTNMGQDVRTRGVTVGLESNHHHSQEAGSASDHELRWLKSSIQEKDKALEELKAKNSHLMSRCEKVEAQLAQKVAQESLKTGSHVGDHANPSTLEDACKSVDKATDSLIRVLHLWSITSTTGSSKSHDQDLERFLSAICPASLANFSGPVQVQYAWGHWVCVTMFNYFEHVFFAVDDMSMTSPLDSKIHALECFRSFQEKKHMSSLKLYDECWMFRAFCDKKYSAVFPAALIEHALHQRSVDSCGQFDDECIEIYQQFLDVAKAVWLLHELAFSFDPPATILRMATGLPFDKQYHESALLDDESNEVPQTVLLLLRPAFRVRDAIIRSRVFCLTSGHVDFSRTPEVEAERG